VLCGIGPLPATLHSRSIVVPLKRAKPGEVSAHFDPRKNTPAEELCRKLARWTADNRQQLEKCDPKLPPSAHNRLADNWRPLFAIAEIAGGAWPQRAMKAFLALTDGDKIESRGIGTMLLADIAAIFHSAGVKKISSATITKALADIEGHPWAEFGKMRKPISPNQLAARLRDFEIAPTTIKFSDGKTAKGYFLQQFEDAFQRYLPAQGHSDRNPVTQAENTGFSSGTVLWDRQTIKLSFVCGCQVLERKPAIGVGLVGDQWGP
jgi:hypothetical protein